MSNVKGFIFQGMMTSLIAFFMFIIIFRTTSFDYYMFSFLVNESTFIPKDRVFKLFFLELFFVIFSMAFVFYCILSLLYFILQNKINLLKNNIYIPKIFYRHSSIDKDKGEEVIYLVLNYLIVCVLFLIFDYITKPFYFYDLAEHILVTIIFFGWISYFSFLYAFGIPPINLLSNIKNLILKKQ